MYGYAVLPRSSKPSRGLLMSSTKRAALYVRVSTDAQTVENQIRELRQVARRRGWDVVEVYNDAGISGAKGRNGRPGLDSVLKDASRRKFDVVMAWAIDRLGRSLSDLLDTIQRLEACGVDLYLDQQAIDTTTPMGKLVFQVTGAFAEFERTMIRQRIKAGLKRAVAQGVKLGRPKIDSETERKVRKQIRLEQSDPATWIAWDYAGRVGALAVLGAIPSALIVTFQWERLRMTYWEAAAWIIGIVLFDHYVCGWIRRTLNTALPATVLGAYPETHGWLHIVDAVFGLALVAYSEEVVFRRCARHLFQFYLNDGYALIVVTSLLFGAYHWWTGIGNIIEAVLIGALLMLFYRRSTALWPVVLAHYLTDVVDCAI